MPTLTPIFPAHATLLPQRVVVSAVWSAGAILSIPNAIQIAGPAGPAGVTGPQGEPGLPDDSGISAIAGEALSAGRVVYLDGEQVRYYTPGDGHQPVGLTTTAALIGGPVTIQSTGRVISPGWSLTPGRQFARHNGTISATPPASGLVQSVGVATDNETLFIQFFQPINTL